MVTSRTLHMGAIESWGEVRIGALDAADEPGAEYVRLRVTCPDREVTVRVLLGQSIVIDGVGTVALTSLALHHSGLDDDPDESVRGTVELCVDTATEPTDS